MYSIRRKSEQKIKITMILHIKVLMMENYNLLVLKTNLRLDCNDLFIQQVDWHKDKVLLH